MSTKYSSEIISAFIAFVKSNPGLKCDQLDAFYKSNQDILKLRKDGKFKLGDLINQCNGAVKKDNIINAALYSLVYVEGVQAPELTLSGGGLTLSADDSDEKPLVCRVVDSKPPASSQPLLSGGGGAPPVATCKFFATQSGCRSGDNCKFSHVFSLTEDDESQVTSPLEDFIYDIGIPPNLAETGNEELNEEFAQMTPNQKWFLGIELQKNVDAITNPPVEEKAVEEKAGELEVDEEDPECEIPYGKTEIRYPEEISPVRYIDETRFRQAVANFSVTNMLRGKFNMTLEEIFTLAIQKATIPISEEEARVVKEFIDENHLIDESQLIPNNV